MRLLGQTIRYMRRRNPALPAELILRQNLSHYQLAARLTHRGAAFSVFTSWNYDTPG
jgi:hypothetical protein